ncbi:NAD-dependent epimerase/dehydratase family protein [Candidatus Poribacteria bacterium]|nr:NAD-dependent epimerase/dehydratase family protein [Candidatus Poribacteria bacterium]
MIHGRRILMTGGGGFIGTVFAEALAATNQVILYDIEFQNNSFSYSSLGSNPNVHCVRGDLLDTEKLRNACADVDIVVHLAAVVGVQQVQMNTVDTLSVNLRGTQSVLDALPMKRIERFVYFSSSEVYGTHAYAASEGAPTPIGSCDDPRWCYAVSKVASEHVVAAYHREYGLPTVILRPFNIFGPKRLGDHAILRFIYQALNNAPLTVHNDGSAIRSWCYISDFVDGALRALENENAIGRCFNVGNALNTVTMYQLASDIIELCGSRSGVAFVPYKQSDVHLRVPDISHARDVLGYEPQVPLIDGLRTTRDWYQRHAARIAPLFLTR